MEWLLMVVEKAVMDVSLEGFSRWYLERKESLLQEAKNWNEKNQSLVNDFLNEWPLERLRDMTIDEYVVGKGAQSKSFCYELEHGKYADMYLSIRGGSAGKFGIYWSNKSKSYCDQNNQSIPESEVQTKFSSLKTDLLEIITSGILQSFNDISFTKKNSFYSRPAIVMKLLCAYTEKPIFAGINMNKDQKTVWGKLVVFEEIGGVYKQNFDITTAISKRHTELDGKLLSVILWSFRNAILQSSEKDKQLSETGSQEDVSHLNEYNNLLLKSKNIVLRGAPGTGKTYLAQQIATCIISSGRTADIENLTVEESKQLGFVQFHPSYDYTDFVEGLRPTSTGTEVGFELEPGIFKAFCERANEEYLKPKSKDVTLIDNTKPYVFIIDEINRGEISKIFGELFFSLDPGYRGPRGGVLTQYSNLHEDQDEKFFIPQNVYIIGTMNDIDRSVDTFDFAMRRRFTFIEISAEQSANNMLKNDETKALMTRINEAIIDKTKGGLTKDYQIGASYFLTIDEEGTSSEAIRALWDNKLFPLLTDYFRGEHESERKLKYLEDAYFAMPEED